MAQSRIPDESGGRASAPDPGHESGLRPQLKFNFNLSQVQVATDVTGSQLSSLARFKFKSQVLEQPDISMLPIAYFLRH